ncbi:MAG: hypothetical protein ACHP65_04450 [Legionellales bacterium]
MKQGLKIIAYLSSLVVVSSIHAGTMGTVVDVQKPALYPFISLEGSWTALDLQLETSSIYSIASRGNNWGGRLAGGIALAYRNDISFTAESGWSYLGKLKQQIPNNGNELHLSGADLLLGVQYQPNHYGLFLKAGTLLESATYKAASTQKGNLILNSQNVPTNTLFAGKTNLGYILPEIKVGAVYDKEHWGLSLAYTHAFGIRNPFISISASSSANNTINISSSSNLLGVEINSILLGAHYNFFA